MAQLENFIIGDHILNHVAFLVKEIHISFSITQRNPEGYVSIVHTLSNVI